MLEHEDNWNIKCSSLEYRTLELCIIIIEGYEIRLEEDKRNLNELNIPLSSLNFSTDYKGLHNSTITLQLLLGLKCLPNDCQYPQTLETALQMAGMSEETVKTEVERCEGYLEKANNLRRRSSNFAELKTRTTYDFLMNKLAEGETLTPEERKALESAGNILAEDH